MNAKIYKCFIASPSDTQDERQACDEVFSEINASLGEHHGFRIESVRWEKDAVPGFGQDGQEVINQQLKPGEHDFFVGILWCRFGVPTPRAESGTAEEFDQAYSRWKETGNVRIQIYFNNTSPKSLSDIDPGQLKNVQDFKKKVAQFGGLYAEYDNIATFKDKLRQSIVKSLLSLNDQGVNNSQNAQVVTTLTDNLNKALSLFSDQPVTWINRVLCETCNYSLAPEKLEEKKIRVDSFLLSNESCVIKASAQFGLTCLAHYMIKEAWQKKHEAWVYISCDDCAPTHIIQNVQKQLELFQVIKVDCIIVDSWSYERHGSKKVFETIEAKYPDARIIILHTISESLVELAQSKVLVNRQLKCYALLALPRSEIRNAVKAYSAKIIDDENTVLNKLILDFDALNIHRTPMNCWTLLKASESNIDRSIINRTQMLERVLFVLFNSTHLPMYQTSPDVKDCEHVLGYFCEGLIRESRLGFTENEFHTKISNYCSEKLVAIDVAQMFKILVENRIIIKTSFYDLRFKATFWVYYFAAKRMHNHTPFREYILSNKKYALYPEIIEFYTGIDRNRNDVLSLLVNDLRETRDLVDKKLGFQGVLNPLKNLTWQPKEADIEKMQGKLSADVLNSNVPDAIKDLHADKSYNQLKPYNQNIRQFLYESSFLQYQYQLSSASKALRNSDYAEVELRRSLLKEVIAGWTEESKVIFVLSPILSHYGQASFDGSGYYLDASFDKFRNDKGQLFFTLLQSNTQNVIRQEKDDIASDRIGPLFQDFIESNPNALSKHLAALFLISVRPHGWEKAIEKYIVDLDKNAYFLLEVYRALSGIYKYDFLSPHDDQLIAYLLKKCLAKNQYSINNPVGKIIHRISDSKLPVRENVDQEE